MEEEQILDPHEGSSLADAAEEAIDNAGSKVGVETGCGRRPDAGADHDGLEEERDRQTSEKTSESDDEESASSNGEEVANHRALHRGLSQMPLPTMPRPSVNLLLRTWQWSHNME